MKWVALLGFGLFGAPMLIGGIIWTINTALLERHANHVDGVVTANEISHGTETQNGQTVATISYYPVVEYHDDNGGTHHVRGRTGSSSPDFSVGDHTTVAYERGNPDHAVIAGMQEWFSPIGVSIAGLLFLGAGVGGFFMVQSSDNTFGPAFDEPFRRMELKEAGHGTRVAGKIVDIKQIGKGKKLRWSIRVDGAGKQFFSVPFEIPPDPAWLNRTVTVYVNPIKADEYYIDFEELNTKAIAAS